MQFCKSNTCKNLARSFAGESQAGMRYQLIAKQATAEEYIVLADTIRTIAKNETYHAKTFFDTLVLNAGSTENIVIDAGYPFHFGTLTENLRFAAEDERAEFTEVYPAFAEEARKDRVPLPARVDEGRHAVQARQAHPLGVQRMRLPRHDQRGVETLPAVQGETGPRADPAALRLSGRGERRRTDHAITGALRLVIERRKNMKNSKQNGSARSAQPESTQSKAGSAKSAQSAKNCGSSKGTKSCK